MAIGPVGILWDRDARNQLNGTLYFLYENTIIRPGKNIFNKKNVVPGRLSSAGNLIENDTEKTSNYELIEPNQTYITNQSIWYAQYDADKEFVKWEFVPKENIFTTDPMAVFIRISVSNRFVDVLQVEKGTNLTEYEPYMKVLNDVEVDELYEAKKSTVKSKKFLNIKERFEEIERDIILLEPIDKEVVDDDTAEQVFINEMNKKANLIGCENSTFKNSSGLSAAGQLTSPKDIALITRQASGISEIQKVWGTKNYDVNVKGPNTRIESINTTVQNDTFEQTYEILGGKTGTLGIVHNLSVVAKHKTKGYILTGTILRAETDRWVAMKQLLDETVNIIENKGSTNPVIEAVGACSSLLPNNPLLHSNADLNELYLKGNDRTSRQSPASLTKILTAIILIENIPNLNESFTYKTRDKVEDVLIFNEGDRITFKDALYLMLLQSNNTTAKAIARVVGQRIVKARGYA